MPAEQVQVVGREIRGLPSFGSAAQSAQLQRVSANSFTGRFNNAEYDISGTINITVRGNKLNASLSAKGGSASFAMSR